MSAVDGDAWTCPDCGQTVRGTSRARRAVQRAHGRATARGRACPIQENAAPRPLTVPPAPRATRRIR